MDEAFYISLPKLELHAHLNGSLSEKTLKELHVSQESISDFHKLNKVLDLGPSRTLAECFEIFKIAHSATSNIEAVYIATQNVIKEFADDGVIYLELRTTPRKEETMSKREYINAVLRGIEISQKTVPKIKVKLIVSLDRRQSIAEAEETINLTNEYREKFPDIIVGIDVSGDPTKENWFSTILQKVRQETDLKITVHCAEVPNEAETNEILDFKPDRLGHGTCIHPDNGGTEELWQKLINQKIPVECCLTSNVKTKSIKNYESHHLPELMLYEIPFSICTDDKGVFSTSLSQEFQIAANNFRLCKSDLWRICLNTIQYTFCSAEEKDQLKTIVKKWFQDHLC